MFTFPLPRDVGHGERGAAWTRSEEWVLESASWVELLIPPLTISVTWRKLFKGPKALFHICGMWMVRVLLAITTAVRGQWHHQESACLALNLAFCDLE